MEGAILGPGKQVTKMSQFQFLKQDFEQVFEHVRKAEMHALSDPRGACFWARLSIETIVNWIYKHEKSLAPSSRRFSYIN